ncbi:MAG TPA: hypothetical protein EYO94_10900 [Acidobacteria bacterium]|nr:hypothetical protein [Acidobacteriota bacterium]
MKAWAWLVAVGMMAVAVAGIAWVPVGAHHASAPFYDGTKSVEANGVVTRFVFRNPHSFLYVDAEGDAGEMIAWEIEMGAAVMMSRRGWTPDTIKVGDRIKVVGQPSRAPGTFGICCAELTQPGGDPIRPAN